MSQQTTCPECGGVLPPDAPKGFCPVCLVRVAAGWEGPARLATAGGESTPKSPQGSVSDGDSEVCLSGGVGRADPAVASAKYPVLFGGYELLAELGRGGMGVVYRARQVALNRPVAIKMLLHGAFSNAAFVERFQLEAEAAAHLDHPHIVPVYEVGQVGGQPFYSMRLIHGSSLAQVIAECRERNADWLRYAAELLATIARAAHHAHERGVLHRDIKPHNILLDAEGQPYLADFGLAKLLGQEGGLTLGTGVIGSPEFMAPEQAAGKTREVTTAADVYGLGAVLYALLTGKAVFRADTPLETVRQVIEQEPVKPRLLNPAVDRNLETICLKCLQKEPVKRYASAQALAEDLECWLRAEPIQARRATPVERVWLWCRRQPVRASLTGALALALVLGVSGVVWQWKRATASELQTRQNAYAADLNWAQVALEKGDLEGALAALDRQRPAPRQRDLRGWEWRYFWQRCQTNDPGSEIQPSSPTVLPIPVWSGAFTFGPDGNQFIAVDNRDGVPLLWHGAPLRQIERLSFLGVNNETVRWSPDGQILAVGDRAGTLRIWDYPTRRMITNYLNPGNIRSQPQVLRQWADSFLGTVADTTWHCTARLWDTRTWREIRLPPDWPATNAKWAAVSYDNTILAALDADGTVAWWNMATGRRLKVFKQHFASTDGYLSFSPVNRLLAGSATDGQTTVWDTATGRIVTSIRANFRAVHGVAFSPDGRRLLSGGEDPGDVVRLLDLGSLRHVATLTGPQDSYWFLEMSADGNTLAVAGMNKNNTLLWRAPSWAEIEATERRRTQQH